MDSYRQQWNGRQGQFRRLLLSFKDHETAVTQFLSQHARLHTAGVADSEPWSFEDEVFEGASEAQVRRIPRGRSHSIAWIVWHIARIEDVTMHVLLADAPQVLHAQDWYSRLQIDEQDVGTRSDADTVAAISAKIDIDVLRAYRSAVGRSTQSLVPQIPLRDLKQKPEASRLQRLTTEGAVIEEARGLIEAWGSWQRARLLSMPITRHSYTHLNEALLFRRSPG